MKIRIALTLLLSAFIFLTLFESDALAFGRGRYPWEANPRDEAATALAKTVEASGMLLKTERIVQDSLRMPVPKGAKYDAELCHSVLKAVAKLSKIRRFLIERGRYQLRKTAPDKEIGDWDNFLFISKGDNKVKEYHQFLERLGVDLLKNKGILQACSTR